MFRLNVGSGADHWLATGHLDVLCLKLKFLRLQCVPFALGLVGLDVACTCSLHGVLPLVAGVLWFRMAVLPCFKVASPRREAFIVRADNAQIVCVWLVIGWFCRLISLPVACAPIELGH